MAIRGFTTDIFLTMVINSGLLVASEPELHGGKLKEISSLIAGYLEVIDITRGDYHAFTSQGKSKTYEGARSVFKDMGYEMDATVMARSKKKKILVVIGPNHHLASQTRINNVVKNTMKIRQELYETAKKIADELEARFFRHDDSFLFDESKGNDMVGIMQHHLAKLRK
ncbi:hypothetical protein COT72_05215 [archaeon CG10_big_fil_rev_8_21_14_0_10_43_11]|nr:MAG: hypothetical protein COT72_05215 [archaeon CG10_big_fil_rev_8_21_14_0_10_43_11]